jgi:ABC-type uncharacterized transport system involved in gliding motility auxiliary subunit
MADDPKDKDVTAGEGEGSEKSEKKTPSESDQSVTRIERPRRASDRPETEGDDEAPKAKAKAASDDDEPAPKPKAKRSASAGGPVKAKRRDDDEDAPRVKRPAAPTGARVRDDARKTRAAGESGGLMLVAAGVLVLGNMALRNVVVRYDATRDEKWTLSKKGTAHLLSTLTKDIKIKVYAPEGLATVDAFIRDLRDLLEEYKRYGNGKVSYEIVHLDALEGEQKKKAEDEAAEAGLKKQVLGEAKGGAGAKQASIGEGYLGMVMVYGGERVTLEPPEFDEHNAQGLEFFISNKIRELRDKEDKIEHKIGFLQGHKEPGYQELSQIFTRYFPYYKLEAVDLAKGEKAVDEKIDGLIIAQPDEEITSKELRRIDQFLMRGKTVAVFANNVHIKGGDANMTATFTAMGLDKLLSGYGVDYKPELLVDRAQFWTPILVIPRSGMGMPLEPYPGVFTADASRGSLTFDNKFPPFFRLSQLAIPFPTELTVDQARAGGDQVKVTNVIKTTANIATIPGTSLTLNPERFGQGTTGVKPEKRQANIAVALEGPLKSAFPGGGEGVDGVPANAPNTARLLVVSSGAFFGNIFQEAGKSPFAGQIPGMDPNMGSDEGLMRYAMAYQQIGRLPSIFVAKQTCDWMTNETDLLATAVKLQQDPEITYRTPAPTPEGEEKVDSETFQKKRRDWTDAIRSEQTWTKWSNMIGGSSLILLLGLVRWWRRNSVRAAVKI